LSLGGIDAVEKKGDMSSQVSQGILPLDIPQDIQLQDESTSISSEGQFGFQLHLDIPDSDSENALSPIVVTPLPPQTTHLSMLSLSPLSAAALQLSPSDTLSPIHLQSMSSPGLSQLQTKVLESLEAQLRTKLFSIPPVKPKSTQQPSIHPQTHDEKNIWKSDLGFDVRGQGLTETPVESLPSESVKVKESGVWTTSPITGLVDSSTAEPVARPAAGRPRANRKRRRSADSRSG
jgi:hypothetical protein